MKAVCAWLVLLLACLPAHAIAKTGDDQHRTTDDQHLIIEALRCRGNINTSCRFILGSVYLAPGDRLNEEELRNAQLRLSWLRNFKSVDIHLEKGSERGKVVVVVEVSESNPIATGVSIATERLATSWTQVAAGRATDYDLFGAGKILDLQVSTREPISGPQLRNLLARVQYVDPHLLDSQRYFLAAGLSGQRRHFNFENGDSYDASIVGADISLGRRLFDFAYLTLGYQYRPVSQISCYIGGIRESTSTFGRRGTLLASLGRNTQDDPDFPTHGWVAQAYFSGPPDCSDHLSFQFDQIFRWGADGFLEVRGQAGEVGIRYWHVLRQEGLFRDIQRGRWYIEPGLQNVEYGISQKGGAVRQLALRAGVRFESAHLGIVDLSVYATTDRRTGAGP
jgi:outer membrane protein assembly factor BamA